MDFADIGSESTEALTEAAIARVRAQAQIPRFPFTGHCYNCERGIKEGAFCDADCREDYEDAKRRFSYQEDAKHRMNTRR